MDWIKGVTTDSTFPPKGTFLKSAEEIAEIMSRAEVSPLGIVSGIRMINYFINRAGSGLSKERKVVLRRAITLLRERKLQRWNNPPTNCAVCKKPFDLKGGFFVCRKKSDIQLIIVCPYDYFTVKNQYGVAEFRPYYANGEPVP